MKWEVASSNATPPPRVIIRLHSRLGQQNRGTCARVPPTSYFCTTNSFQSTEESGPCLRNSHQLTGLSALRSGRLAPLIRGRDPDSWVRGCSRFLPFFLFFTLSSSGLPVAAGPHCNYFNLTQRPTPTCGPYSPFQT